MSKKAFAKVTVNKCDCGCGEWWLSLTCRNPPKMSFNFLDCEGISTPYKTKSGAIRAANTLAESFRNVEVVINEG